MEGTGALATSARSILNFYPGVGAAPHKGKASKTKNTPYHEWLAHPDWPYGPAGRSKFGQCENQFCLSTMLYPWTALVIIDRLHCVVVRRPGFARGWAKGRAIWRVIM